MRLMAMSLIPRFSRSCNNVKYTWPVAIVRTRKNGGVNGGANLSTEYDGELRLGRLVLQSEVQGGNVRSAFRPSSLKAPSELEGGAEEISKRIR